jgi:hypothetical protein
VEVSIVMKPLESMEEERKARSIEDRSPSKEEE